MNVIVFALNLHHWIISKCGGYEMTILLTVREMGFNLLLSSVNFHRTEQFVTTHGLIL